MRSSRLWLLLLVGTAALVSTAVAATLQSRVEAAVFRDLGLEALGADSSLTARVLSSGVQVPDEAQLRVAAVHKASAANDWLLRLECDSRRSCLPFEVLLRSSAASELRILNEHAGIGPPVVEPKLSMAVVSAGDRVQLTREMSGMRLTAPGVCLQRGSLGQRIRVRNTATGRVVFARVLAPGRARVEE